MKYFILTVLFYVNAVAANTWNGTGPRSPASKVIELERIGQVNREMRKPGVKIILYYTDWCPGCTRIKPIFDKLSDDLKNYTFYRMNIDNFILKEHDGMVRSIPKMYVGTDGQALRTAPCEIGKEFASLAQLKLDILECLEQK